MCKQLVSELRLATAIVVAGGIIMKKIFLTLVACLSVALCTTACGNSSDPIPEDAYSGNVTVHVVGYSSAPRERKMYSSKEYAFEHPYDFTVDHKDTKLEVKMYLGDSTSTEYLKVGESELFTITDENGNNAYVYITYAQDYVYRFWGID